MARDTWSGTTTLVAKVSIHEQQICGLAWSPDGGLLASGGNDDICCLFDVDDILGTQPHTESPRGRWDEGPFTPIKPLRPRPRSRDVADSGPSSLVGSRREDSGLVVNGRSTIEQTEMRPVNTDPDALRTLGPGSERRCWVHGAAVKAIAFCPWSPGLLATGGGSSDRCIHFFHTRTGAALATIFVSAQVTSLVWSTTRREIAATLGYSQPDHPYRIALFSWPECTQVAAIPWGTGSRALYAIPYPTASDDSKVTDSSDQTGCLVVASSDNSIKFHELWPPDGNSAVGGPGTLAGSDILESLEGIDKEGEVIR